MAERSGSSIHISVMLLDVIACESDFHSKKIMQAVHLIQERLQLCPGIGSVNSKKSR